MPQNKHSGSSNQGFVPRNYAFSTQDNSRHYPRGEGSYHLNTTSGAGPGVRTMHHAPPQQPPTPPTPQEMKPMPGHLPPPQHGLPPQQQAAQMMYPMTPRGSGTQSQFHQRAQAAQPRMPIHRSQGLVPSNQGPQYIPQQIMPFTNQMMPSGMTQAQILLQTPINHVSQYMNTQPSRNSFYPPLAVLPPYPYPVYFNSPMMRPDTRQAPNVPGGAPPAPQPGINPPLDQSGQRQSRREKRPCAIPIIDPNDGRDIVKEMLRQESSSPAPRSGESSARETPQPSVDSSVPAEFARKVMNSIEVPSQGLNNSNYSETDSQPKPELQQNASSSGIASPKIDVPTDIVVGAGDQPMVDNNVGYPDAPVRGWAPPIPMDLHMGVPMHPPQMMVLTEDIMRPSITQPREYGHVSWPPEPSPQLPPNVAGVPSMPPAAKKPERTTPVVSALVAGPAVDIGREFPALGGQRLGTHQSPGRPKRKQGPARPEVDPVEGSTIVPEEPVPQMLPQSLAVLEVPAPTPTPEVVVAEEPQPPTPHTSDVLATTVPQPLPSDAKVNQQKSKSNKRHQQRLEQQQRQAAPAPEPEPQPVERQPTPPPPAAAQVVEQVEPPKLEEKLEEKPVMIEVKNDERIEKTEEIVVEPSEISCVKEEVLDKKEEIVNIVRENKVEMEKSEESYEDEKGENHQIDSEEKKEELLVAAMNEENIKMSAANNQSENNNIDNKLTNNNNNVQEPPSVIEPPKPVLRHSYKDDQWSPINPEGKKRYEREFIMQLMNDPQSKKRPDNLPYLELLKDSTRSGAMNRGPTVSNRHGGDSLMPSFIKSPSLRGPAAVKQRLSTGKMRPNKPMPIQLSLSLNDDVKLRESERPWKPARVADDAAKTEEQKKTEVLYKRVRGVLNKLTPQKFNTLLQQVRELPIDTVARLRGVIDLVFEKAVEEPGFSTAYADMCAQLAQISVPDDEVKEGKPQVANFRNLILQKCQNQFEADSKDDSKRTLRLKEIEELTDPDKKKELQLQLEEDDRRARIKDVGNIRFVGELFKKRMLTFHVVYRCIETLLKHNNEDSYECLCKLLSTIGQSLDEATQNARTKILEEEKNRDRKDKSVSDINSVASLDKYFVLLGEVVKNKDRKKISSRVRFMIQDLIDLRKRKWVPRRDDSNPKTMDQIAKDAEREMLETNLALNAQSQEKRNPRQDSRPSMNKRGGGSESSGGWTQVTSASRASKYTVELEKLRINQNEMDLSNNISLGSRTQFMWNQSNSGSKSEQRNKQMAGPGVTQNKFALLEEKPPSRSSSLKGNAPPEKSSSSYKATVQDSNQMHEMPVKHAGFSQANRDSGPPSRSEPNEGRPRIDNERETRIMLDEFHCINDVVEARTQLDEKFGDADKEEMVYNVFQLTLEKSESARRGASRLLAHFLQTDGISKQHFLVGLSRFMETTDDLAIDIPKLWEYLAELIVEIVLGGFPLASVLEVIGPCSGNSVKLLVAIVRIIHTERSDSPVLSAITPVLTAYFGGPMPFHNFVKDHNLEFLESPSQPDATPRPFDENRMTEELHRLLRSSATYETITSWVDANVRTPTDPAFVRALTTALLSAALVAVKNDSLKLDVEFLEQNDKLFFRYIDHIEELELHCLFAIQDKLTALEHPKGILLELWNFLHDQGIISSDSFRKWFDDDSKNSKEKGVCKYALTSFYTMLAEGDDDDTS